MSQRAHSPDARGLAQKAAQLLVLLSFPHPAAERLPLLPHLLSRPLRLVGSGSPD